MHEHGAKDAAGPDGIGERVIHRHDEPILRTAQSRSGNMDFPSAESLHLSKSLRRTSRHQIVYVRQINVIVRSVQETPARLR